MKDIMEIDNSKLSIGIPIYIHGSRKYKLKHVYRNLLPKLFVIVHTHTHNNRIILPETHNKSTFCGE